MESSNSRRWEKRGFEHSEEDSEHPPPSKRPKLPALSSVIVDALKIDSVQRLSSSLEPLLRRIVSEEVERALTKFGHAALPGRPSPPRIQGPEGRILQLHFKTRMPPHLFTGGKVEGEQGAAIHVVLLDVNAGSVVQTGPESAAKLDIVVLEGDFSEEAEENWTAERFESQEVKEREGKRPLLNGELHIVLKNGIGTLGDLTFTDNSSWIRSRKFRLGVKVAPGYCDEIRVREAKTEAFAVKDHRGELYKKHYPPALHDEVWRLDRIAKDGALHKKLVKADILTVEDFLRVLVRDSQRLRNILGSGMSNRMWENTAEHAKTCVLGRKLYVYYTDDTRSTGVVFNHIYELRGLIAEGQFLSLESLTHSQKINVDTLVKRAYEHWNQVVEYDGKVLNSLTSGIKRGPVLPNNFITDHHHHQFNNAQSRQQYIPLEPSPPPRETAKNHPSVPELIEFPFARPDPMAMMSMNDPQGALSGGMAMDYMSAGTPYYPGDSRNEQGMEDFFAEDIRLRSSEMLESDDMQKLLRTFGVGNEGFHSYSVQYEEPAVEKTYGQEQGRSSSGKAVVGWLKLKAALRWGIFVRKRAAERRAQLTELD